MSRRFGHSARWSVMSRGRFMPIVLGWKPMARQKALETGLQAASPARSAGVALRMLMVSVICSALFRGKGVSGV